MQCSEVGAEAWLFVSLATVLVVLLVVRAKDTQRWLREHRWGAEGFGLMFGLQKVLEERHMWLFLALFGAIPLVMWGVSVGAIYCFFHGADLPAR